MSPLALALTLALGAGPAPQADVFEFLSPGHATSPRDGSAPLEWQAEGAGQAQLRLSLGLLKERNEAISNAEMLTQALMQTVRAFFEGGGEKAQVRQRLVRLAGPSLDEVRESLLTAVQLEQKRITWVQRALDLADTEQPLQGVDRDLVGRRAAALQAGKGAELVEQRVRGYRSLASGLVAYIDGDALSALEKMKAATRDTPEVSLAHAYLGSLYYLFQQPAYAAAEWRKALELDPRNTAVAAALKDHAAEFK
ncbi:hypothetical protein [Anaeromyxobacter paludicola]|uniref:Tetratricopeptide repeat protein n=1 Tax=Anaeromyxobacter paludicola TaxID=2918171 RepID=A0ABM7X8A6_9BACT|nr:hypothetical protein [Anaeromyxobacter paludicola]BDG08074.1 hypothetical protein AMPC_11870 [Anaeromyxobacter paludicola]